MLEMAAHIGVVATLRLVDRFGGMRVYIPKDPDRAKAYEDRGTFADAIGSGAAELLSRAYGGEDIQIPTGRYAVSRAKRAPILADVHEHRMTAEAAARKLGTSRTYIFQLLNDELGDKREVQLPSGRDPGQMALFGEED